MLSLLWLALFPAAQAGQPLLHSGDPATAVADVTAAGGLAAWELDPVTLDELAGDRGVSLLGGARERPCEVGPSSNGDLQSAVGVAEKLVLRQRWAEARDRLEGAADRLPCLGEPAEASLVTHAFFLAGVVAVQEGRPAAARAAFYRSQQFQPGRDWDSRYPPDGQPLFDDVAAATEEAGGGRIVLGPGLEHKGAVWVDGRLARVDSGYIELPAGTHLVQVLEPEVHTFEVDLEQGDVVGLADGRILGGMDLGALARSPFVEVLLSDRMTADGGAWLYDNGAVWHLAEGTWGELPVPPPVDPTRPVRRRSAFIGVGATAAGVGVVGAGLGWYGVASQLHAPAVEDYCGEGARQARVNAWLPWAIGSSGLAAAGGALLAVGLLMDDGTGLAVGPPPPGMTGLSLTWAR